MYSILLIDDEKLTLDYLALTIPKQDADWQIAAKCSDGFEAIDWLKTHSADLIITDIRMPEMSGLDLCRHIKEHYPKQKIIILSGFDEFKFAQQAIKYGVNEYLLKPISLSELEKTLRKMKNILHADAIEERAYASLLEMSEDGKKQIASRFLLAVIYNSNVEIKSSYPLIHRMKISLLEGAGMILAIALDEDMLLLNGISERDIPLFKYMVYRLTLEFIEKQYQNLWVILDRNENTVILLSADTQDTVQEMATNIYKSTLDIFYRHTNFSLSAGISNPFDDVFQTDTAYYEALSALNSRIFQNSCDIRIISKIDIKIQKNMERLDHYSMLLRTAILDLNTMDQQLIIKSIIKLMPNYSKGDIIRFGLYWIKSVTNNQDNRFLGMLEKTEQSITKLVDVRIAEKEDAVQELYTSIALLLSKPNKEPDILQEKSMSSIVSRAKNYIHTNYAQPISLTLVAEELDVSPNYLSALFQKELGESYIKYLTRIRMEHATRLIRENPQIKIYEIVEQVGYVSVKHFSYVFKQTYAISPSEYQQNLL